MITGCQAGAHDSDKLVEGFMTIFIPDRDSKKNPLVTASGTSVEKKLRIQLGVCSFCAVVYRIKETDEDSNSGV